jgi:hypothetical protein
MEVVGKIRVVNAETSSKQVSKKRDSITTDEQRSHFNRLHTR